MADDQLVELQSHFSQNESFIVAIPEKATIDHFATALAIFSGLQQQGKTVYFVGPEKPNFAVSVQGSDKLDTNMGKQNLTISFDYTEDQVDKVSYHIGEETQKFYLTIKPKKGTQPLDSKTVEFSYTGIEADAIVLVGVKKLEDLAQLYYGYEDFYQKTTKITLASFSSSLGNLNVDWGAYSSLAEGVLRSAKQLNWQFDSVVATNLLYVLEEKTKGLQSVHTSPEVFEAVATLLRAGAKRLYVTNNTTSSDSSQQNQKSTSDKANKNSPTKTKNKQQEIEVKKK